ncbi:hypothetical protein BJ875DRAFT_447266 [Amylocarpus encephaloides]|uniref:Uncharacterized protein n=1 Tax=Amylocarpus encephaloides TaxID=45428 RepID=A0A9P7Y640_9HELO|nr:hypothetical protein BJ875DRAFT_447266 [Amylocarpus encephaloides]
MAPPIAMQDVIQPSESVLLRTFRQMERVVEPKSTNAKILALGTAVALQVSAVAPQHIARPDVNSLLELAPTLIFHQMELVVAPTNLNVMALAMAIAAANIITVELLLYIVGLDASAILGIAPPLPYPRQYQNRQTCPLMGPVERMERNAREVDWEIAAQAQDIAVIPSAIALRDGM